MTLIFWIGHDEVVESIEKNPFSKKIMIIYGREITRLP